ncbi:hypothetical protein KIP88_33245 [Bradyrhizobium sp. SRL28]|uniref:hypothetical protein n=1 Tax=Bradyrhizobium sp. SRL28 TaxID=2836178 RepID=UPI001BDF0DF4|nr:hypothetical protein [Bradyrhizobium sp. SRL28]MBT1515363.1 hypothetical protein [Bradyrhizobium sp. SRL28]
MAVGFAPRAGILRANPLVARHARDYDDGLLEYVASVEAKDPEHWPDLADDNAKRRSRHFFLIDNLTKALRELMPVTA